MRATHKLVVNWRPCIQCYGATMWSGVRRLAVAGEGPELEEITGFDEGPLGADWAEQFEARGITVVTDVLREEALAVYREYRAEADSGRALVYNARRPRSSQVPGDEPAWIDASIADEASGCNTRT